MADDEIRPVIEYLNRYLHDIFVRTGGGDDLIDDSGENVASTLGLISRLNSLTSEAEKKLEDIDQLTASLNNGLSKVEELKNNIENLEQTNSQKLLSKIEELESKIENSEQVKANFSGLDELNKRVDDLEQVSSNTDNISGKANSKVSGQDSSTDNAITRFNGEGGKTIQDSGITIDDSNKMLFPLANDAADPTIQFGDGDSGFYEESDDVLVASIAGVKRFTYRTTDFRSEATNSAALIFVTPSATVPSVTPNVNDPNTGIGANALDQLSAIAGGVEVLRFQPALITSQWGTWDATGFNIMAGDVYKINTTTVLSATALGGGVTSSSLTSLGTITSLVAGAVNTTGAYSVDGTQVVSNQGAAVSDASGGATIDAEARTAINSLLARVRVHGLIA